MLSGVKLFLVLFNLIWSGAAIPPRRCSLTSSAVRLINWTAKPFIKFNKALFGGSGDLVLVTRAATAIPANHIIIMRLYCGSETPPPTSPLPPLCFLYHPSDIIRCLRCFFPVGIRELRCLKVPAIPDKPGVISHLVKITQAVNAKSGVIGSSTAAAAFAWHLAGRAMATPNTKVGK